MNKQFPILLENIKSIFLATPITPLLQGNTFNAEAEKSIKHILSNLRSSLCPNVFCAIEREEWGKALMTGDECTVPDFVKLKEADLVIAFADHSYGVHVELGWASALGKPIILCVNEEIGFKSPLVEGLATLTPVKQVFYKNCQVLPDIQQWNDKVFPKITSLWGS